MDMKQREHMPDILKGHAIFGVAFIHSAWTLYS
jgi:uncharacterized membrane protein YcfT